MFVRLRVPVDAEDHALGARRAPVTVVMYGDYECPWCRDAQPIVQAVRVALKGRMRLVFRHFPMPRMHPHAQHAAEAAEAAADRGRFWPMHDLLYGHQEALADADLARYAASIGIDPEWVGATLRVHTYATRVQLDFLGGVQSGVSGTPTFFINDVRYDGECAVSPLLLAVQGADYEARRAAALRGGAELRHGNRRHPPRRSPPAGRRAKEPS